MAVRRYLFDSNAVTSFINRREPFATRVRSARQRGARMGTCEPVVAELFYGLEFSASRDQNRLRLIRVLERITSWPFDRQAAERYGSLAADLRRRGRPMQVVDMMLAAVALSLKDCTVVTTDSDLLALPMLHVENWEVSEPQGR